MKKREAAAIAFIKANNSRAVRTALMARGRPTRNEYFVGEYVYYWRKDGDPHLQKCHWRGPALVSMIEPSPSTPTPRVYWLVHGTSLIRCVHEQLRPELPEERSARPVQTSRRTTFQEAVEKLRKVRGPVNFVDITTRPPPTYVDIEEVQQPEEQPPADAAPADAVGPVGQAERRDEPEPPGDITMHPHPPEPAPQQPVPLPQPQPQQPQQPQLSPNQVPAPPTTASSSTAADNLETWRQTMFGNVTDEARQQMRRAALESYNRLPQKICPQYRITEKKKKDYLRWTTKITRSWCTLQAKTISSSAG